MTPCSICGGTDLADHPVLWDGLVSEWQLAPQERAYVDRQQGTACTQCGCSLRAIALADAIRAAVGARSTFLEFAASPEAERLQILEINEAGGLTSKLALFPRRSLVSYPAVDMHALPFASNTYDLVVHSDTLEHVSNPVHALAECRRVLTRHGALCFTVPTIVGRLTRSRSGLAKSYHGSAETLSDDLVVHTEFGADMWSFVMQAGFSSVTLNAVDYPSALAVCARG